METYWEHRIQIKPNDHVNIYLQEEKLSTVCDFLHTDRELKNEVRDTLASLNISTHKRRSRSNRYTDDRNEINSTGSFLSDLSVTQFDEDDFLEMSRPFKKHRASTTASNISYIESKQKRRSTRKSMDLRSKLIYYWHSFLKYVCFMLFHLHFTENTSIIDLDGSDQIVATAKITIPQGDGPILATSSIETVPNSVLYDKFRKIDNELPLEEVKENVEMSESATTTTTATLTPSKQSLNLQEQSPVPSAPPLQEITNNPKFLLNLPVRQHEFNSRTIIRSESCVYCLKK